ncbi:MAG: helix-turn-helix domain-containing protein [Verrucomicrobiia bacterium]|jgi:AraC-like DNA-binding protein
MDIWQQLAESEAVRRLQVAFGCATGLPLTLLPASEEAGGPMPAAFCVEGCMGSRSGHLCQGMLLTAERNASRACSAIQFCCPTGLTKVLMPVMIDGQHVGNLLAGPFCVGSLNARRLRRLTNQLKTSGLGSRAGDLKTSWSTSAVVTPEKLRAVETLLEMFAQYLAEWGQRLLLQEAGRRSPLLQKIEAHLAGPTERALSVSELAQRLHISPCYFCKLFKKQTGLTFTTYRTQARIDGAKRLLLDPRLRISEVAYESGFESIPYFNRAFRRHVGCSPSEFRARQTQSIRVKKLTNRA